MADDVSAITLIQDAVETSLIDACQTQVDSSDITRAFVVRSGLLQDDPTQQSGINILIHPNKIDTSPDAWAHGIATNIPGFNIDPYAIGGCVGQEVIWTRRFIAELRFFFPERRGTVFTTRSMARAATNVLMSRCEKAVVRSVIPPIDSFGEKVMQYVLSDSWQSEAGGDGQWIWYCWIKFLAITGRQL